METKYGIPQKDLDTVVERDKNCVYCHKTMISPWNSKNQSDSVTIEHLNHKQDWDSVRTYVSTDQPVPAIIAICCGACNSSRGSKSLYDWFETKYCNENKICYENVSQVVKNYIDKYEKQNIHLQT